MAKNIEKFKYRAFISYKHSELGRKYAINLERGLKRYAKPIFKKPMAIFRDEKIMVPDIDLPKLITNGLDQSEFFILIAEKESATSFWCIEEIKYWCEVLKRIDKLIIIHINDQIVLDVLNKRIEWQKTNAIPIILKRYIISIPFYIDLKWAKNLNDFDFEDIRFKSTINLIVAKLRGVAPEELNDEEFRIFRINNRIRIAAIFLLSFLLIVSSLASLIAYKNGETATLNLKRAIENEEIATLNAELAENNAKIAEQQRNIAENARDSIYQIQLELQSALAREKLEKDRAIKNQNTANDQKNIAQLNISLFNDYINLFSDYIDDSNQFDSLDIWVNTNQELKFIKSPILEYLKNRRNSLKIYFPLNEPIGVGENPLRTIIAKQDVSLILYDYYVAKDSLLNVSSNKFNNPDELVKYYEDYVIGGYTRLLLFTLEIQDKLERGEKVEILIKGYTRTINGISENLMLGQRRVNSVFRFFHSYRSRIFKEYLDSGQFIIVQVSFGEALSPSSISDLEIDNNKFYLEGALEDRVEIIWVSR